MKVITIYLNDNTISIINKDKILTYESISIENSNIISKENFIKEFLQKRKESKIISSIISYKLNLILNQDITDKEIIYYKNVFEDLNIIDIKFYSINEIINKYPMLIHNKNNSYLITNIKIYNFPLLLLDDYIRELKLKKLFIVGNNKNILVNDNFYIFSNKEEYLINKIKEKMSKIK